MTDELRKAAEMALEALEAKDGWGSSVRDAKEKAIQALRTALAQQGKECIYPECETNVGCDWPCGSAVEQEPVAWMPIDSVPKGRIVLVHYKNSLGNGRTMRARYYLPETLESDSTESGWADEGWYEESEAYEYLMPLEYEPTHWMPLPAPPDTQLTHTTPVDTVNTSQEHVDETAKRGHEPVAKYMSKTYRCHTVNLYQEIPVGTLLYTAPPKREWVGLTDQEIEDLWNQHEPRFDYYSFSCDIEAKLKEKNT